MTQESLTYWQEREEKIFARRDESERAMARAVGVDELTPEQVYALRSACSEFERCEEGIERVQEQMRYWSARGERVTNA